MKLSIKLFEIIDAYHYERIQINATISNNKYHNKNIRSEFGKIHKKLKHLERTSQYIHKFHDKVPKKGKETTMKSTFFRNKDTSECHSLSKSESARSDISQNQNNRNLNKQEIDFLNQMLIKEKDDSLSISMYRGSDSSIERKSLSTNQA